MVQHVVCNSSVVIPRSAAIALLHYCTIALLRIIADIVALYTLFDISPPHALLFYAFNRIVGFMLWNT